jgi:ribosomal protein L37AE/L43A
MQHYRCPKCGADAYSSASASTVTCPKCAAPLASQGATATAGVTATK